MSKAHCPCGHFWSQHDQYGCQFYKCECVRIDRFSIFRDRSQIMTEMVQ